MVKWTKEMLNTLQQDYLGYLPKEQMIIKYQRSWESIKAKCTSLKYYRDMPKTTKGYKLKLSKSEIIDLYKSGFSADSIAKICNCSTPNIIWILKQFNITRRLPEYSHRKYTLDDTFFDIIDTEEKAYFLGFLYADGNNNIKNNTITLSLVETDREILEKLSNCIQSNKPLWYANTQKTKTLKNTKNQYRLLLCSNKLSTSLIKLGCVPNKTHILTFPSEEQVPKELQKHFIRGVFDGDGCIYVHYKNLKDSSFSIYGNRIFLECLQKCLMENCNLKKTKLYSRLIDNTIALRYSGLKQISRIYTYLYQDSTIFLNRKYEKFNQLYLFCSNKN